jgi:cyclopropane-fatty-acyl-phospholipid synthase
MSKKSSTTTLKKIFSLAGVTVNGNEPYDIKINDDRVYRRVLRDGALGLGEAYMDGWWDCGKIDQFFCKVLKADLENKVRGNWKAYIQFLKAKLFNLQKYSRAFEVGEKHYDIGNEIFMAMLDKRMNYSCGYWKDAENLDQAQEAKLDLICKKIRLEPGMNVLDLGCGWGSFAKYAAEKFNVRVTGVTVSREQVKLARKLCKNFPIEIKLEDYRQVLGTYDRIISIGFMEHVGYKNYRTYMNVVDRCLDKNGIAFIHTIGENKSKTHSNAWTEKYIFPNGMLPSISQLGLAMENLFIMEDWHNFGPDYDKTLMAWYRNFVDAWPKLKEKYNDRFFRMWKYYLLSSAGGFRARATQLWQIVMTKMGSTQPEVRFS